MGKVLVQIERTSQGYVASMPDVPGTISAGDNLPEIERNLYEAIGLYKSYMAGQGEPVAKSLENSVEFEYQMQLPEFSGFFDTVKQSTLARLAGIHPSLLRQYVCGLKQPGPKQAGKIEQAIHELGRKLLQVRIKS